jgi:c-di-GMP-binding flagellar brake protein YcgR
MSDSEERRQFPRYTVDPMYSAVTVERRGRTEEGHVYDVSLGGMRFELDRPVRKGSTVDVEISLPGCASAIRAKARVVRVFSNIDDPGPRRMAVEFETFADGARAMLERYLDQKWLRRAPGQDDVVSDGAAKAASTSDFASSTLTSPPTTRSASAA